MGGHGAHKWKVPDYRIYKVEDIPELVQLQKLLKAQGLHDPWARNEVWRFYPKFWGTKKSRMILSATRGFKVGLVAAIITVIAGKILGSGSHHDDHH